MLAAASVAAPMPNLARLDALSTARNWFGGVGPSELPRICDQCPVWAQTGCDAFVEIPPILLPEPPRTQAARLLRQASLDLTPRRFTRGRALPHVFGGNEIATSGRICGVVGAHASIQGP